MKSSSRNGAKVRLIAVHTTEGIMKARDLIAFFDRANASGSSHAGADRTGALLGPEAGYVPYDRAAWTLRNGNPVSDNLEYCGWARYTREQWLTTEAKGLEAIAQWIAQRCKARGIPPVKLSPAEVRAGKSGVIGHTDWTTGMNDGTHWDPGPGFPWDVVMARVKEIMAPATAGANVNTPGRDWLDMATEADLRRIIGEVVDEKLRPIYDTLTPGIEGRKFEGELYGKIDDTARVVTTPHDYRSHHGNPEDDVAGHTMTVLQRLDTVVELITPKADS